MERLNQDQREAVMEAITQKIDSYHDHAGRCHDEGDVVAFKHWYGQAMFWTGIRDVLKEE